ncbi:hypothetical protein NDU88_006183 [Pleurodeles waltl]|uniref:Secreted protein n=1 Tax=Pleurodeles waltl TaxID=8319 RepID=A0AAV7PQN3_PLEWA|nr:hypothetical protein NDU88_006183 [Pleurodeles waltl]
MWNGVPKTRTSFSKGLSITCLLLLSPAIRPPINRRSRPSSFSHPRASLFAETARGKHTRRLRGDRLQAAIHHNMDLRPPRRRMSLCAEQEYIMNSSANSIS